LSTISSKSVLTTMHTGAATAAAPFEAVAVSVVAVAVISLNRVKASCLVHTSPLASKAPST
jgi:hypothetical protein